MPKFKDEDRVRVIGGAYAGQTGIIYGNPTQISAGIPAGSVAEGHELATEPTELYEYQVDLEGVDVNPVAIMEADLEAA